MIWTMESRSPRRAGPVRDLQDLRREFLRERWLSVASRPLDWRSAGGELLGWRGRAAEGKFRGSKVGCDVRMGKKK